MEPFYYALMVIYLADASTMAYLYKSKFGRLIFAEIDNRESEKWVYDNKEEKYRLRDEIDKLEEEVKKEERLQNLMTEIKELDETPEIKEQVPEAIS